MSSTLGDTLGKSAIFILNFPRAPAQLSMTWPAVFVVCPQSYSSAKEMGDIFRLIIFLKDFVKAPLRP